MALSLRQHGTCRFTIVLRTYAVGVLAGARGPLAPENLLFPPTCGGIAATGGWKKKGVLWRALPSKPPNRVSPVSYRSYAASLPMPHHCHIDSVAIDNPYAKPRDN